jgi:voltage-gated potassium channel
MKSRKELSGWRLRWYEIVFESDTPAGKLFDVALLVCILLSILIVIVESVPAIHDQWRTYLVAAEWLFTVFFTLEFILRLTVVLDKRKYVFSFFGLIDLLSILPTYLALFIPGTQSLLVIRSFRLLRIFRIFKLVKFVGEGQNLMYALRASRYKIIVFLLTISTSVIVTGTLMFIIEGPEHEFTSIPKSIYWAIVTMTTVGYGDIAPQTPLGQAIASLIMIMGYGIIAVPTGIVTSEMMHLKEIQKITSKVCPHCLKEGHDPDASYCKYCSGKLN